MTRSDDSNRPTDGQLLLLVPSNGRGVSAALPLSKQSMPFGANVPTELITVRIEFDGGTPCNIPRLGYGKGYGSYKIWNEPVHRCHFNRSMSANAAELFTLNYAIKAVIDRGCDTRNMVLYLVGDSRLVLDMSLKIRDGRKIKTGSKTSPEFREGVLVLRELLPCFAAVSAAWQPRRKSVKTFGH